MVKWFITDNTMKTTIYIGTLKKLLLDDKKNFITVFGIGDKIDLCSDLDKGTNPYEHYLDLEGNAEILNLKSASPIWENLLEDGLKGRAIYRITDEDSWMELVIL